MNDNNNNITVLARLCSINPETIQVPSSVDEKTLLDFINSTRSALEQLEGEMVAFELSSDKTVLGFTACHLLSTIKRESVFAGFPEIACVCLRTRCLLDDCDSIPIETLRSVKDWLRQVTEHIISSSIRIK